MGDATDRRKYPRVRSEALISIARLDQQAALAQALDASGGGLRFQCVGLDLALGDLVKVTLTCAGSTVLLVGPLVRVENLDDFTQEVAMRFVRLDEDTRARLLEFFPEPPEAVKDERREYGRVPFETVVSVSRASLVDAVAQAQDVSAGGIRFVVEGVELEQGDVLRLSLRVGDDDIVVIGQLTRLTDIDGLKQEAVVAFVNADPDDVERIRKALAIG